MGTWAAILSGWKWILAAWTGGRAMPGPWRAIPFHQVLAFLGGGGLIPGGATEIGKEKAARGPPFIWCGTC